MTSKPGETSTASHYDQRGAAALMEQKRAIGAEAVPLFTREPYSFVEQVVAAEIAAKGPIKVLDFCCGTGIHGVKIAQMGADVTGIDLSPQSIVAATALAKRFGVSERTRFHETDSLRFLAEHSEEFDLVFVSGSLYYFDPATVFAAISRSLREGGILVAVETSGDNRPMRVVRWLRSRLYHDRDAQTLTSLFGKKQVELLSRTFAVNAQVRYFDFLTLFGRFLPSGALARAYHGVAAAADRVLLRTLMLSGLGFKFVFAGRRASRSA